VDIGGPFWNFEMRDAAARSPAAPRVAVAGPLISMVDRVKLDLGDPPIIKITSADAARALVRRELERKPDFIKVWFIHQKGDDLAAQEAIVKAAGDAAHAGGARLAVHATELIVAKASLRAGADFLVHSVEDEPVDEEFLALAKKNRALYCPTLFVIQGYRYALSNTWQPTEAERRLADPQILAAMNDLQKIPKEKLPERVAKAMSQPVPPKPSATALQNLRRIWDAGITVVMGTDAGNIGTLHGPSVFREMEIMTQAGLTPLQVLRSATSNGAKTMGMERGIGSLAPGRLADLVILDADPLADVLNLSRIHRVIHQTRGQRVLRPLAAGGRIDDPVAPFRLQLDDDAVAVVADRLVVGEQRARVIHPFTQDVVPEESRSIAEVEHPEEGRPDVDLRRDRIDAARRNMPRRVDDQRDVVVLGRQLGATAPLVGVIRDDEKNGPVEPGLGAGMVDELPDGEVGVLDCT